MLTDHEIDTLIAKLRNKYNDYAHTYNAHWFSVDAFEERLQTAWRNKINMEAFIVAEIAHFEKIKQRYEQKNTTSFSTKVDALIEELTARINHYPEIAFHPEAHFEIMHMYGACNQLLELYFPVLWLIIDDRSTVYNFEQQLHYLCGRTSEKESKRIEDHIALLNRHGVKSIEIEKNKNEYLKECAFLLHAIHEWLNNILNNYDTTPLNFSKLYIRGDKKHKIISLFNNETCHSALATIQNYIHQIIEDFRLQAFKKI